MSENINYVFVADSTPFQKAVNAMAESTKKSTEAIQASLMKIEKSLKKLNTSTTAQTKAIAAERKKAIDEIEAKEKQAAENHKKRLRSIREAHKRHSQATVKETKEIANAQDKVGKTGLGIRTANAELLRAGHSLRSFGGMIAASVVLPMVAAGAAAWKIAGDYDESLNKVRVVFGDASKDVEYFAKTTMRMQGIAETTSLEMLGLYGDMATSMGFAQDKAAKLSEQIVGLVGDVASLKNLPIKQVETAFQAIFTGEARAMRRLGVIMTVDAMQHWMRAIGESGRYMEKTLQEKIELRMKYVNQALRYAVGDFNRTFETTVNQMRYFREQMVTLGEQFGHILMKTFTPLLIKLNKFLEYISGTSEGVKKLIIAIGGLITTIAGLLVVSGILLPLIVNIKIVILSLGKAFVWVGVKIKAFISFLSLLGANIGRTIMWAISLRNAWAAVATTFALSLGILAVLGLVIWGVVSAYSSMTEEGNDTAAMQERLNDAGEKGAKIYTMQKKNLSDLLLLMKLARTEEEKKSTLQSLKSGFPTFYEKSGIKESDPPEEAAKKIGNYGMKEFDRIIPKQKIFSQIQQLIYDNNALYQQINVLKLKVYAQKKPTGKWNLGTWLTGLFDKSEKELEKAYASLKANTLKLNQLKDEYINKYQGTLNDLILAIQQGPDEPGLGQIGALEQAIQDLDTKIKEAPTRKKIIGVLEGEVVSDGWEDLTKEKAKKVKELEDIMDVIDLILNPPEEKLSDAFRDIEDRAKTAGESFSIASEKIKVLFELAGQYAKKHPNIASSFRQRATQYYPQQAADMMNEYYGKVKEVDENAQEQATLGVVIDQLDILKQKYKLTKDQLNEFSKSANKNQEAIAKLKGEQTAYLISMQEQKIIDFNAAIAEQVQTAMTLSGVYNNLGRDYDLYGQLIDIYTKAIEDSGKVAGISAEKVQEYYDAVKGLEYLNFDNLFITKKQDIYDEADAMKYLGLQYNKNAQLMAVYQEQVISAQKDLTGLAQMTQMGAGLVGFKKTSTAAGVDDVKAGMKKNAGLKSVNALFKEPFKEATANYELFQSAISAATDLYGEQSTQVQALIDLMNELGIVQKKNAESMVSSFEDIGKSMAMMLAEGDATVNKMIKQALSMASAWLIESIMLGLPFPANVVVAMGAGALIGQVQNQIPEFKDGAIVSGPTLAKVGEYPGASTNPEVIMPLDKLKSYIDRHGKTDEVYVHGQIAGDVIYVTNERYSRRKVLVQ